MLSDSGREVVTERSNIPSRKVYGVVVDSFYSHAQVGIVMKGDVKQDGKTISQEVFMSRSSYSPDLTVVLVLYNQQNRISHIIPASYRLRDSIDDICTTNIEGVLPGTYTLKWGIESCLPGRPSLNSVGKSISIF